MTVSAADPVNLVGIIVPGTRVPSQAGRQVVFVDGLPEEPESAPTATVKTPVPSRLTPQLASRR